jgi:hypothetical protein
MPKPGLRNMVGVQRRLRRPGRIGERLLDVAQRFEFLRAFGNDPRQRFPGPEIADEVVGEDGAEAVADDDNSRIFLVVQLAEQGQAAMANVRLSRPGPSP